MSIIDQLQSAREVLDGLRVEDIAGITYILDGSKELISVSGPPSIREKIIETYLCGFNLGAVIAIENKDKLVLYNK